jgi:hypothetical protein
MSNPQLSSSIPPWIEAFEVYISLCISLVFNFYIYLFWFWNVAASYASYPLLAVCKSILIPLILLSNVFKIKSCIGSSLAIRILRDGYISILYDLF